MEANAIRDGWLASGWKRGALVDLKSTQALCEKLPNNLKSKVDSSESAFLFPILYDCALVEPDFEKEPWVQVMICWECEKNNQYLYSRDPRKSHFPLTFQGNELWVEVTALGVYQLEREILLSFEPTKEAFLNENELSRLLNWVAERYRQPTFPDEFNNRLSTKDSLLKRLWKKPDFASNCSGVYFSIEPFNELPPNEKYQIEVLVTIPYEISGKRFILFEKDKAPAIVEQLKSILSSVDSFSVKKVLTISELEFTRDIERKFKRHPLEYYSYKLEEEARLLPTEFK